MADPLSVVASIVSISSAGLKISFGLITLAEQVAIAPKRITRPSDDISLTCGILCVPELTVGSFRLTFI